MSHWIEYLLFIIDILTLIVITPQIYKSFLLYFNKCTCAIDAKFIFMLIYFFITVTVLIISILGALEVIYLPTQLKRILMVLYFFMTCIFVLVTEAYIKNKAKNTCSCLTDEYDNWLKMITFVRWVGVYIFGVILMSAGMFLFLQSKNRLFSFPQHRWRSSSLRVSRG